MSGNHPISLSGVFGRSLSTEGSSTSRETRARRRGMRVMHHGGTAMGTGCPLGRQHLNVTTGI